MKVLSLTEPYATLIRKGIKTIETRSWKTSYRGKLYIHASSTRIPKEYRDNDALMSLVDVKELNFGQIICSCEGVYAPGRYAWIFKDIVALGRPIPAKGHLGIWNLTEFDN